METIHLKAVMVFLSFFVTLCVFIVLFPKLMNLTSQAYLDAHGVTAAAEGTVSNKQYIAAHTDYERSWLFSSSTFYPEKYEIQIRRYDTSKSKYETASYDIDKSTYDELNIGDHFKDTLNRTVYFKFDPE